MPEIIVIAHNIRSAHNVGSIFRTCEGFGVKRIIFSGYTPYPEISLNSKAPPRAHIDGKTTQKDPRLPHVRQKITRDIHKTALGAEAIVPFEYHDTLDLGTLDIAGYRLVALEQAPNSIDIHHYQPTNKIALLLGEEVHGIEPELLKKVHDTIEIPMRGKKESFNVSVATGIALYALTS